MKSMIFIFISLCSVVVQAGPQENYEALRKKHLQAANEANTQKLYRFILEGISLKGYDVTGMKATEDGNGWASNNKLACAYSSLDHYTNPANAIVVCFPTQTLSKNARLDYEAAVKAKDRAEFVSLVKAAINKAGVNPEGMIIPEKPDNPENVLFSEENTIYMENTIAVCKIENIPHILKWPLFARCLLK